MKLKSYALPNHGLVEEFFKQLPTLRYSDDWFIYEQLPGYDLTVTLPPQRDDVSLKWSTFINGEPVTFQNDTSGVIEYMFDNFFDLSCLRYLLNLTSYLNEEITLIGKFINPKTMPECKGFTPGIRFTNMFIGKTLSTVSVFMANVESQFRVGGLVKSSWSAAHGYVQSKSYTRTMYSNKEQEKKPYVKGMCLRPMNNKSVDGNYPIFHHSFGEIAVINRRDDSAIESFFRECFSEENINRFAYEMGYPQTYKELNVFTGKMIGLAYSLLRKTMGSTGWNFSKELQAYPMNAVRKFFFEEFQNESA